MKSTLNEELIRVQKLLEKNNNSFLAIVCPRFMEVTNPHPKTTIIELNCTHSTKENINRLDWAKIVAKATEINKENGGKAAKSTAGDIVSGRMISIRNGQGLAVAITKENITRNELYNISDHKTGYTLSFVLPTHSKKVIQDKDPKPRVAKKLPDEVIA